MEASNLRAGRRSCRSFHGEVHLIEHILGHCRVCLRCVSGDEVLDERPVQVEVNEALGHYVDWGNDVQRYRPTCGDASPIIIHGFRHNRAVTVVLYELRFIRESHVLKLHDELQSLCGVRVEDLIAWQCDDLEAFFRTQANLEWKIEVISKQLQHHCWPVRDMSGNLN